MIIIQTNSLKAAYCQALNRLFADGRDHGDPELYRESVGVIEISPSFSQMNDPFDFLFEDSPEAFASIEPGDELPPLTIDIESLDDPFPYHEYFPRLSAEIVGKELTYWNQQLFKQKKLKELIDYLKANPLSKRAIILFWEDAYRDLSKGAVCEIAIVFRMKDDALEMHTHMRANNATFLLFMDMRILMGVQAFVARQLGVSVGSYIHFIDSLHIYEAERYHAVQQLKFNARSPLWDIY